MTTKNKQKNDICCPEFQPEKWDEKMLSWENKPFIKASVPTFFHIPYAPMLGKKITKMMQMAENSDHLAPHKEDILLLFTDPHPFRSDIYLSVTGKVPDAKNTFISGTFMSKVYDGVYKDVPQFIKQMDKYLKEQNKKANQYYIHYAYCPKCAEKFGNNYMVLFAEI